MISDDSSADAAKAAGPPDLEVRDLERLRVAGQGARLAAGTGVVGLGLAFLQIIDVVARHPAGLGALTPRSNSTFISTASSVIASLAALALLWAYGRNISAYLAGGSDALAKAFRYLRFFFVVWTCAAAVTVLLLVAYIW